MKNKVCSLQVIIPAIAILFIVLIMVFYGSMVATTTAETTEVPGTVYLFLGLALGFAIVNIFGDFFYVVRPAMFCFTTLAFFNAIEGRVSYLAFYFTGDAMNTGLSLFLILWAIFFILLLVYEVMLIFNFNPIKAKENKTDITVA